MGRGFVDVVESDSVIRVVDIMIDLNLRSLPIIQRTKEGRLLTGIVSRKDVLRCFVFDGKAD